MRGKGIIFGLIISLLCSAPSSYAETMNVSNKHIKTILTEGAGSDSKKNQNDHTDQTEEAEEMQNESDAKVEFTSLNLISVGDIMMHEEQIVSGYQTKTKKYDFHYMFEPVKSYIQKGDLAIGNLELTLSGADKKYTGYPCFNAPDELAHALKSTGFDIMTTANNHSLDRRFYGVKRTLDILDQTGIEHTGTFRTKEESEKILIKEIKGIKIAFLAYTYGTNGIGFDKGKEFSVSLISKYKITQDIAKAKKLNVDLICVSMHFGEEYQRKPNARQNELTDYLIKEGADIILGSHPHVLQPIEIKKIVQNGKEKQALILYSQGNFISTQRERYTDCGAIFDIEIVKSNDTGHIDIREVTYIPTWVDLSKVNGNYHFRILPAKKYIHIYEAKKDSLISQMDAVKLKRALKDVRETLKSTDRRIYEKLTVIDD